MTLRMIAGTTLRRLGIRHDIVAYPPLAATIAPYISSDPVIVEAGAHVGSDTLWLGRLAGRSKVHAFEPVPSLFRQLTSRTRNCRNVRRYSVALSDTSGTVPMHISSGDSDASSSLREPKAHYEYHPDVAFDTTLNVECMTLDAWARRYHVPRVDFLYLDMQGHELTVLQSAPVTLRNVEAIYSEVSLVELYEGSPLYPEYRAWLESQGFRVAFEDLAWEDFGNVLFVRRNGSS